MPNHNQNYFPSIFTPSFKLLLRNLNTILNEQVKETLISYNYLPRYNIWSNLAIFSANEISKMRYLEKWLKLISFTWVAIKNISLWFKIVFPLTLSIARHRSPIHIQPNVTISGRLCSSSQEHQIASPWVALWSFLLISVWVRVPSQVGCVVLSTSHLPPREHIFLKTRNAVWINGFLF